MTVPSDEACIEAYQREIDYVFRTLRRLGVSSSEVDDLAQEVFLALRQSWREYDPTRPLRPYLFGISFRIASNHQRRRRREVVLAVVEPEELSPSPDQALQAKQTRAVVLAALEKLPLPRRAVLVMYDLDDVPMDQVAATLGIPLFTAYSRLRKARRELEAVLRRLLREVEVG